MRQPKILLRNNNYLIRNKYYLRFNDLFIKLGRAHSRNSLVVITHNLKHNETETPDNNIFNIYNFHFGISLLPN